MNGNLKLYRILRFDHAVKILNGSLFFSHPSAWDDPYETHIKHNFEHAIFAQCWSKASMSEAMWRIYSPNMLGVRVRTTVSKLEAAMTVFTKNNKGYKRRLSVVEYLPPLKYKSEAKKIGSVLEDKELASASLGADLLCLKRSAYIHEREVRAIIFDGNSTQGSMARGIDVPVDGHKLIESILIDPRAPDELCNAMVHYLKDVLNFSGEVRKSKLYTVSK